MSDHFSDEQQLAGLLALDAVWDDDDNDPRPSVDTVAAAVAAAVRAEQVGSRPARPPTWQRWVGPIAAGVAAAAITTVALGGWSDGDPVEPAAAPPDVTVTMSATSLMPDARATAAVTARPLGTVIRLDATGLPPAAPGTYYEAWMWSGEGPSLGVSAGTFHMRGGDGAVYLWSGVSAADYPVLSVTVQREGEITPSAETVLRARLD